MKSYNWTIPASSFLILGKFVIPDQSVNPVNFVIPALCRNLYDNDKTNESCIQRYDRKSGMPAFAGMTQGIHKAFITRSVSPITKDHLLYAT